MYHETETFGKQASDDAWPDLLLDREGIAFAICRPIEQLGNTVDGYRSFGDRKRRNSSKMFIEPIQGFTAMNILIASFFERHQRSTADILRGGIQVHPLKLFGPWAIRQLYEQFIH